MSYQEASADPLRSDSWDKAGDDGVGRGDGLDWDDSRRRGNSGWDWVQSESLSL